MKPGDFNRVAYYLDMGLGKTFVGSEKLKSFGTKQKLLICQKSKDLYWKQYIETEWGGTMNKFNSEEFIIGLLKKYEGPILEACDRRGINASFLRFNDYEGFYFTIEPLILSYLEDNPAFDKDYMYGVYRLGALPELAVNIINNEDRNKMDMKIVFDYLYRMNDLCERRNYIQRVSYVDGIYLVDFDAINSIPLGDDPQVALELIKINNEGIFFTMEDFIKSMEYSHNRILN